MSPGSPGVDLALTGLESGIPDLPGTDCLATQEKETKAGWTNLPARGTRKRLGQLQPAFAFRRFTEGGRMSAEYILACGDRTKVPAGEDDELLSRYVWCDECRIWRRVIEQVDPADLDAEVGG